MINFSFCQELPWHQHCHLDFADVRVGRDNQLFIDPSRIRLSALNTDPWAMKANELIDSFFLTLCKAVTTRDQYTVQYLIESTCGELNETQLGWSRGYPAGTGASWGLIKPAIDHMIQAGYFDEGLVTSLADIPIWAEGIDADRLSDWITNLIWPVLYQFTDYQYKKYHLPRNCQISTTHLAWNPSTTQWESISVPAFLCHGESILLCPKRFLHTQLLLSTEDFLCKVVLEYRQREHLDGLSPFCHSSINSNGDQIWTPPTKKELLELEVYGHSHTNYVHRHARQHPEMLTQYHRRFEFRPGDPSKFLSDEELDTILYS